jgi:hypothetical protein
MEILRIILASVNNGLKSFKNGVSGHNEIRDIFFLVFSLEGSDVVLESNSELEALENVFADRFLESLIASRSCSNNLIMDILGCCNKCTVFICLNNL